MIYFKKSIDPAINCFFDSHINWNYSDEYAVTFGQERVDIRLVKNSVEQHYLIFVNGEIRERIEFFKLGENSNKVGANYNYVKIFPYNTNGEVCGEHGGKISNKQKAKEEL